MKARQQQLDAVLDDAVLSDPVLLDVGVQYDLGQWRDVRCDGSGFRISAEAGEFVVAVSPAARSDASLRFEVMLSDHLADMAYLAPRLVRTRAGRPWHRSTAGASVLVTEWVTGGAVDADLAQHRRRSVRALAEYHAVVRSFPPRLRAVGWPTPFALGRQGPTALEALAGISGWYLDADGRRRFRSAASYLWRQYLRLPELLHAGGATLPRLVIHGDFGRGAVILDGGQPSLPADGLTGFARARFDVRALDLAAALKTFARVPGGFDLDRCAELVAAYDEVDRLTPGEVEALPSILRVERLVRVFRLTSRLEEGAPESVIHELVNVINNEAVHLRWLEEHEAALIEALGSALVA
ncbi:MAG TPA: phosphotransferase [Acidimicrobiia bacterium]|nr:phosphotransferase [Acidimicrobiia bacterium]